jgi:pimeloyl-ACP methyl ester carboxylesterase
MTGKFHAFLDRLRPHLYGRKRPLILINGLAEQAETWFRNDRFWRNCFDVHMPNLITYEGDVLHRRVEEGLPISVDFLVEQLHAYLEAFVQSPPYNLVASSLGGKVAVEYAVRYPDRVARMVLLCPSGLGDVEQLPVVDGVRRSDFRSLIESVFFDPRHVDPDLVKYYREKFVNRRWRAGLMRTIRGTMDHTVRGQLPLVRQPTLLVSGREDRIVSSREAAAAANDLPNGHFLLMPHCGHAPQMEKAWMINRLVVHFLTHPQPTPHPPLTQLILSKPSTVS